MAAGTPDGAAATALPSDDAELLRRAGLADASADPARGLFRDDGWLRRVSADPVLLMGGGRALLLEIAHPLVAAGVADHSNFRADPWGRLRRTLDALRAIVFGDRAAAIAAARSVERAHARVRGTLASDAGRFRAGTSYSGRQPDLMLWVWATLVDTALVVRARFVGELDEAAREEYTADQGRVARLLGIPASRVPPRYADFRGYFDAALESDARIVSPAAREIAAAVLHPPGGTPGGGALRALTAGLLPPHLRAAFGLTWDDEKAARFDTLAASVRALRRAAPEPS